MACCWLLGRGVGALESPACGLQCGKLAAACCLLQPGPGTSPAKIFGAALQALLGPRGLPLLAAGAKHIPFGQLFGASLAVLAMICGLGPGCGLAAVWGLSLGLWAFLVAFCGWGFSSKPS